MNVMFFIFIQIPRLYTCGCNSHLTWTVIIIITQMKHQCKAHSTIVLNGSLVNIFPALWQMICPLFCKFAHLSASPAHIVVDDTHHYLTHDSNIKYTFHVIKKIFPQIKWHKITININVYKILGAIFVFIGIIKIYLNSLPDDLFDDRCI